MSPEDVEFVLVRPARAANVAAACRALKNTGFTRLALVGEPPDLGAPEARSLAYGAWDVLDSARRCPTLAEAVGRASFVVATSGRASVATWTPRELAERAAVRCGAGSLAVVFGPEASGLTLAEQALCHETVRIPTHAAQPSLNLAQAVLVVAYELSLASPAAPPSPLPRASAAELEAALESLREGLLAIGYLNPDSPDAVLGELRRLLARAGPTPREIVLLRGLARQIGWAAGVVGQARAVPPKAAP